MKYKDILVYLDDGASNEERINTALSLARAHGARLTGITLAAIEPLYRRVLDEKMHPDILFREAEQRIADFEAMALAQAIEVNARIFKQDEKEAAIKLAQYARNFDLVILRQANPDRDHFAFLENIAEQVILLSGRPVFFMPYIGAHRIPCQKAMIAWDGTPAATRAVHDALPMLVDIDEVVILVVKADSKKTAKGELLANDLSAHLGRHGVNTVVRRLRAGELDVQTVILNEIAENDIDLLVMGGYGTPSLKQKIFGGVTQLLLNSMTTPVVMSH